MDLSRNLGLISQQEQDLLSKASILICGCGGMGGVCAEVLVRMGVKKFTLVDHDKFEASNSNRQIHCNQASIGKFKADVLKEEFLKINPEAQITVIRDAVNLSNVKKIIGGAHVVVNGMDQMLPSICLEREARRRKIPIVDAWITPFASVFTMRHTDPHWEDFLDFPTRTKAETEILAADCAVNMQREIAYTFDHFDPFTYIKRNLVRDVIQDKRKRPSLAPVVWLSGVLMANEVFKIIVGLPEVGPAGIFFDQYTHRLMPGKIGRKIARKLRRKTAPKIGPKIKAKTPQPVKRKSTTKSTVSNHRKVARRRVGLKRV